MIRRNPKACFNPRPRAGGDRRLFHVHCVMPVSIHAPARGATADMWITLRSSPFQSTPPRGGRRQNGCGLMAPKCFNPRPRAGGDSSPATSLPVLIQFQSTPPRGGRLGISPPEYLRMAFQSTPPRGGRPTLTRLRQTRSRFNPRPRAGGDWAAFKPSCGQSVSIHAPARGATGARRASARLEMFQSTPPRGGRQHRQISNRYVGDVSIHAPARGATPHLRRQGTDRGFNPRPRAGGDGSASTGFTPGHVSIHAPARGATRRRGNGGGLRHVSIHAPARGATRA